MKTNNQIQGEILALKNGGQDIVRRKYLKTLHNYTKRNTIIYASAFSSGKPLDQLPQNATSITIEDIHGFMVATQELEGDKLDLIIHSPGGTLEAVDQIVQFLRTKYNDIRAIIPQNAMSAATMLTCACNEVLMGNYSALGPIDPQITLRNQNGLFTAPARLILEEFEQAKEEISTNPKLAPLWATRIRDYPQGVFNVCEQTIQLSTNKVATWLSTYMFKDDANKETKSKEIAEWLCDTKEHKTHGRPIGISIAKEKGLNVKQLEEDPELEKNVLNVFNAITTTFQLTGCTKFIENHKGKGVFAAINN